MKYISPINKNKEKQYLVTKNNWKGINPTLPLMKHWVDITNTPIIKIVSLWNSDWEWQAVGWNREGWDEKIHFVPGQDSFGEFYSIFIILFFLFTLKEKCMKCYNVLKISKAYIKGKSKRAYIKSLWLPGRYPVPLSGRKEHTLLLSELSRHNLHTYKWIPMYLLTHLPTTDIQFLSECEKNNSEHNSCTDFQRINVRVRTWAHTCLNLESTQKKRI